MIAKIPLVSRAQEFFPGSEIQYFLRDDQTRVIFDNADGSVTGLEVITTYVHWHMDKKAVGAYRFTTYTSSARSRRWIWVDAHRPSQSLSDLGRS